VLNLFSGRRRSRDLQRLVEYETRQSSLHVVVLSVDIVFSKVKGDLISIRASKYRSLKIKQKVVRAVVAGPPYDTFSVARWFALQGGRQGLSPLRDREHLWELHDLTTKQKNLVSVSNFLYRAAVSLILDRATYGGVGALEHPTRPVWEPRSASTWYIDYVVQLDKWAETGFSSRIFC
jgi:hypothetical protein